MHNEMLEFILEATPLNTRRVSEGRLLIPVRVTSVESLDSEACNGHIESLRKLYELRALNPPESFTPTCRNKLRAYIRLSSSPRAALPNGVFYPHKMELLDENEGVISIYEEQYPI